MNLHKDRHRTSINFHFLHSVWALNATLIKKNFHFAFHMSLSLCISNVFWPWKRKNLNKHFGSSIAFTGSFLFILLGVMSPRPCYWPYWMVWCWSHVDWRTSFGSTMVTRFLDPGGRPLGLIGTSFSAAFGDVGAFCCWVALFVFFGDGSWSLMKHRFLLNRDPLSVRTQNSRSLAPFLSIVPVMRQRLHP